MWHTLKKEEILLKLNTNDVNGLTEEEVIKRKNRYGENVIKSKHKESILVKLIKQFNDFMIIILILASIVSAVVSYMQGENDYFDSIIIIAIVILNAIMGLIQEEKAEKSIEALKQMTPQLTKVIRNGKCKQIKAEDLVPGDIVILEAGNNIPADCRIIESANLKVEESSLTGETETIEKQADITLNKNDNIGDMVNMAFMATYVVSGRGVAIVTETGMTTRVGKIANMMIEDKAPETPIQRKLGEVGKILGIACLVICFIIFAIGIVKKINPIEMFMTSVGLAVAAIPEGLPAIVTIMLSIGVTKMAKKNSIIRKLPAVETLGSSRVICSDKTGTLTQNKMQVVNVQSADKNFAIELGTMCTDCNLIYRDGTIKVDGEPTELAIVNEGLKINKNKDTLYKQMERIADIPFDSKRKMMSTIHKIGNKYRVITKGAPDVLINHCSKIYSTTGAKLLDNNEKNKIIKENTLMAENALRVIGVSYVDLDILPHKIDELTIERDLIFVGLIGMIDPPRDGVKEAVKTCNNAGIKTVMITGDHIVTAKAIAKELGILKAGDKAITGSELDKISKKELEKNIENFSVFARVTPEHKVRIVKAWQSTGAVVAMTGDGVNDSPALKNADIGIAMGMNGTDVAKNASDMILTDDNFVTIVEAVKQGRNIYDNIKKAVHFLIATNIGEIVTIFMGLVLGLKTPLLAIQLLWINLVTDSFPAIALGLEPAEVGIMQRKPRDPKKGLFADGLWNKIILEGIMIGMLTLFAFCLGNNLYGLDVGRTMAFVTLGLLELIHCFNIKSEQSIFKIGIFENKYLVWSFIFGTLIHVIVVIVPLFANVFSLTLLNYTQWLYTIAISLLPIPIMELQKKINEINYGRVVYKTASHQATFSKNS